jgi:hypothetical protein
MFVFASFALLGSHLSPWTQDQSQLPKALQIDPAAIQVLWDRGAKDAERARAPEKELAKYFSKGIGKIRSGPLSRETVSWIWMNSPDSNAYYQGFQARKKYLSDEDKQKALAALVDGVSGGRKHIYFHGNLNIFPSFGGAYATLDRRANVEDLKGVRVVLEVGKQILQPETQPGDLTYSQGVGTATSAIPQTSTSVTDSTATATAYGTGGYARADATGTSTTTNYYTIMHTDKYSYYSGSFDVVFDLFDKDGKCLIGPDVKEITAIVIYGANERRATFSMDDIIRFRRDHGVKS